MGWTKRQYIEQALSEIGIASYAFDISPEQYESALRQLDSMIATWDAKGIQLGWAVAVAPIDSDLDTEALFHPGHDEAIYTNLAIRLAPSYGKAIGMEIRTSAKMAFDALLMEAARPRQMQYPGTLPAGAGAKCSQRNDPFSQQPNDDPLQTDSGGNLEFVGD